jgi:hypothetical protein
MINARDPLFDPTDAAEYVPVDEDLVNTIREEWLPKEEDVDPGSVYWGDRRGVGWIGTPGTMMKLGWDQLQATQFNPFEWEKVAAFAEIIRSGDGVLIPAPDAMLLRVDLTQVEESQQAALTDELDSSFGMTRPFTSGDEELDEYLRDSDEYTEEHADEYGDEETDEYEDQAEKLMADMAARAEDAVAGGGGDLGKLVAFLRDGNHRAFGAQLAGQSHVWVTVRLGSPANRRMSLQDLGLSDEDLE